MPPNAAPNPAAKKAPPLGIPTWGWVAAIAIGLVVGFVIYKKSGTASADTGTAGSSPFPLGDQSGNSGGGGVVASPPVQIPLDELLQALGIRGSSTTPSNTASQIPTTNIQTGSVQTSGPDSFLPSADVTPTTDISPISPAISAPDITSTPTPTPAPISISTPTPVSQASYDTTVQPIPAGVDPAQAFAASVLGVTPTPNMTLDQLNAQLTAAGMPTQSYPATITPDNPTMISSSDTGTPSPATSMIQTHYLYGRDPQE